MADKKLWQNISLASSSIFVGVSTEMLLTKIFPRMVDVVGSVFVTLADESGEVMKGIGDLTNVVDLS